MKLHFHDWSKWGEPFRSSEYKYMQLRVCSVCNKVQIKQIKQPWNEWFQIPKYVYKTTK